MASPNVFTIDAAQLAGLQEVAAGAQGRIYAAPSVRLDDRWPALYKEFHPHLLGALNVGALQQIIGLPGQLGLELERWLSERAAWPAAIVTRGGAVSGFLMRQAPPGLLPAAEFLAGRAAVTDELALRQSLAEAENILTSLHGWGVTLGPMDPRHLLLGRQPGCFLIGCDAFQLHGASVLPPVDGPHSPESDRLHFARLSGDLLALAPNFPPMPGVISGPPVSYDLAPEYAAPGFNSMPPMSGPPMPGPPMSGPPMSGPPMSGPPMSGPPMSGPPMSGPPAYLQYPPPKPPRRMHGWIIALAALVILVPAAAVAGVAVLRSHHTPAAAPSTKGPSPSANPTPTSAPSTDSPTPAPTTEQPTANPTTVGVVDIAAVAGDPRATAVGRMFDTYFSAINAHDFATAVQVYDPSGSINPNDANQRQTFANGVSTTTDSAAAVQSIGPNGSAVPVRITFDSHQQAGYGPKGRPNETCTHWDVTYLLSSPSADQYKILKASKATNRPC
jgi:eukaryotic-like serine/threonine-protein kinase